MSESLPPLTINQLIEALKNPHFSAYLYLGKEAEKGWKLALAAQKIVPALRVYRIAPEKDNEIRSAFNLNSSCVGVIFGWDEKPKRCIESDLANDFLDLTEAIINAQKQ